MKKTMLALWAVIAPLQIDASTTFSQEKILFRNNSPGKPLVADLNQDGDLDIVLSGSAGIFTLENTNGSGNFGPQTFVGSGRADLVADFNGDGLLDLVVQYPPSPTSTTRVIAWHRNLGADAGFSSPIVIRAGERFPDLYPPYDVDGDGDLDQIWFDSSNDQLEWAENTDGTATTWANPVSLLDTLTLLSSRLADVTGDGIPDFVGQDWKDTPIASDDDIVIFPGLNTTPLTFGQAVTVLPGQRILALADLEGDGDLDLIVPGNNFEDLVWHPNNGSGSFGNALPLSSGSSSEPENINVIDMDGDTDPDVVFSVSFDDVFWVENTNGSGTFAPPVPVATPDETFDNVVVGDLSGDEVPEVLTTDGLTLQKHPNNNNASSFGPPVVLVEAIDWANDLAAADLDGDLFPEIVFATNEGKLFCIPNLGHGFFEEASEIMAGLGDSDQIDLVEVNGQGAHDLLTLSVNDENVRWLASTGPCAFGNPSGIETGSAGPKSMAHGDLDGNGSLDLAVALRGASQIAIYFQDPTTGLFSKTSLPFSLPDVEAVAVGEIDGNPGPDLVAVTPFPDNTVYLLTNNGSGSFAAPVPIGTMPGSVDEVEIVDMDGDSDLDVIAFESDGARSNVLWFPNNGSGTFDPPNLVFDISAGVRGFAVGDLDNDGDIDFVTANSTLDQSRWHENDGVGNFPPLGERLNQAPLSSPHDVVLSDVDNDGDLDIINSSRFRGIIGWYENRLGETPLIQWAKSYGLRGADLEAESDSDRDGLALYLEFACNLDPTTADGRLVPLDGDSGLPNLYFTISDTGSVRALGSFIRRRDWQEVGLTYTIERSPDLGQTSWMTLNPGSAFTINDDYQRVTFNRSISGRPIKYYQRLKIEYQEPDQ